MVVGIRTAGCPIISPETYDRTKKRAALVAALCLIARKLADTGRVSDVV